MALAPQVQTSQGQVLAATDIAVDARLSQMQALAAINFPSEEVRSSQAQILGVIKPTVNARISQMQVLAAVKYPSLPRELLAWDFFMDGHHFYVLQLRGDGTLVFDTLTRRWAEWTTEEFDYWLARHGVNWPQANMPYEGTGIIAGSMLDGTLYHVKPEYATDIGLFGRQYDIVSVVTGGYSIRMRNDITCDEVMVTCSAGFDPVNDQTLLLETSDDMGITWRGWGALDLGMATPQMEVSWQSLGLISQPGRIFRLTDYGAVRTIDSMKMFSRDEEAQNG